MLPHLNYEIEEERFRDACETLPRMTAFFIEEMDIGSSKYIKRTEENRKVRAIPRIIPIDSYQTRSDTRHIFESSTAQVLTPLSKKNTSSSQDLSNRKKTTWALILGISHHFNNLIMGIWGNTSLIRLNLSADHPAYERVEQMEKMIQGGAFLIDLMLGYLGERRITAKRIRLNQLLNEIGLHLAQDRNIHDFSERFELGMLAQQPTIIAGSTARVLDLLLKGVETFRTSIFPETIDCPQIQQRIGIIAALVQKGQMLTSQLQCYANEIEYQKKRISIAKIIQRQYQRTCKRYHNIEVKRSITPRLPLIQADQKYIEWVIAQVIDNACKAMPEGGRLSVAIKPFYAEAPHNRCGVHTGKDYLVVTIEDTGTGISRAEQSRIFEPFFSSPKGKKALGLGLAAALSIVKSHGGYIQVRSKKGEGSQFKIYLPVTTSNCKMKS